MYSTIVHATDLSEPSIPALKRAHELAKSLHSNLVICFITAPPMVASGTKLTDPKTNQTRDITAEIGAIQPLDPSVQPEIRILTIDDHAGVQPVLDILENMQGELLVLGMHPRHGIRGWFGKSITEEVVQRAKSDVLVVKESADETTGTP